ncbi:Hypothetical_protein [Hexamita inflata]|uniref:Hypothetical_protein n=1 Tax=Hexamita inflata TaxID=28002 RepID=A0ABP1GH66_9EUKA
MYQIHSLLTVNNCRLTVEQNQYDLCTKEATLHQLDHQCLHEGTIACKKKGEAQGNAGSDGLGVTVDNSFFNIFHFVHNLSCKYIVGNQAVPKHAVSAVLGTRFSAAPHAAAISAEPRFLAVFLSKNSKKLHCPGVEPTTIFMQYVRFCQNWSIFVIPSQLFKLPTICGSCLFQNESFD